MAAEPDDGSGFGRLLGILSIVGGVVALGLLSKELKQVHYATAFTLRRMAVYAGEAVLLGSVLFFKPDLLWGPRDSMSLMPRLLVLAAGLLAVGYLYFYFGAPS